mgnify:CR=1 FL=1
MTLYEIDKEIQALITEDGEIEDIERFDAMAMERDKKIENVGCWVKNLDEEEKTLAERRHRLESKAERLRAYLDYALCGAKFESPRVAISYRKSKAVEIQDEAVFKAWAKDDAPALLKVTYTIDKTGVKNYIAGGAECPCAVIAEKKSMQVK